MVPRPKPAKKAKRRPPTNADGAFSSALGVYVLGLGAGGAVVFVTVEGASAAAPSTLA
eukprot:CAMPEP_0116868506 /NCGR_PEP_ID=MMETSP0418-20121206/27231_1 /TAXON_ID=1158023 /ORGANISM="Astrosyne radiata, Strain 13vi08-1A" /LENGTH=57 /DNA_ID=CAMNT_0004504477 /DNA_START=21 /DNA_END=190 /DNA_ORIENTATION=+